jgi:DNA-binding PucR family transcriptional regulator
LVTTIGDRIYVLIPRSQSPAALSAWTAKVVERIAGPSGTALRAAVAAPVSSLSDVAAARAEVDRVLDARTGDQSVTTLADSRTPVLLGEIIDLVAAHPELRDPRLEPLLAYDSKNGSAMRDSLEAYLRYFGDVREAAAELQVHPNTLRYRLKRAEDILDINLGDPAGRLLVEIQLAVLRRSIA